MMNNTVLNRRNALKALGGTALLAGGIGAASLTTSAQAVIDVDITGTTIENDQGDVDWVGVEAAKEIHWDGFDVPVTHLGFKHEVTIDDGGQTPWHEVYPQQVSDHLDDWSGNGDNNGWGGPGEYVEGYTGDKEDGLEGIAHADIKWAIISDGSHSNEWDSVQNAVDWTSNLSVSDDGVTRDRVVNMRSTITFYSDTDESGNPVQVAQGDGVPEVEGNESFTVTVVNENSTTSGSSSTGSTSGA